MRKNFQLIASVAVMLLLTTLAFGQEFSKMDASPMDAAYYPARAAFRSFADTEEEKMANQPKIRVLYSRPQKKGRKIWGELEKYDAVWRAGANEAAEILFLEDVTIGDQRVKAGRYTFYVKPTAESWEVHFNTDLDTWGAYAFNADHNVAVITVPVEKPTETIEAFSIMFEPSDDGAHMIMGWDDAMVRVPFKF